jgi:hypothetical protein
VGGSFYESGKSCNWLKAKNPILSGREYGEGQSSTKAPEICIPCFCSSIASEN